MTGGGRLHATDQSDVCSMYNVLCIMYYVPCTMYHVLCTMYYTLCIYVVCAILYQFVAVCVYLWFLPTRHVPLCVVNCFRSCNQFVQARNQAFMIQKSYKITQPIMTMRIRITMKILTSCKTKQRYFRRKRKYRFFVKNVNRGCKTKYRFFAKM